MGPNLGVVMFTRENLASRSLHCMKGRDTPDIARLVHHDTIKNVVGLSVESSFFFTLYASDERIEHDHASIEELARSV